MFSCHSVTIILWATHFVSFAYAFSTEGAIPPPPSGKGSQPFQRARPPPDVSDIDVGIYGSSPVALYLAVRLKQHGKKVEIYNTETSNWGKTVGYSGLIDRPLHWNWGKIIGTDMFNGLLSVPGPPNGIEPGPGPESAQYMGFQDNEVTRGVFQFLNVTVEERTLEWAKRKYRDALQDIGRYAVAHAVDESPKSYFGPDGPVPNITFLDLGDVGEFTSPNLTSNSMNKTFAAWAKIQDRLKEYQARFDRVNFPSFTRRILSGPTRYLLTMTEFEDLPAWLPYLCPGMTEPLERPLFLTLSFCTRSLESDIGGFSGEFPAPESPGPDDTRSPIGPRQMRDLFRQYERAFAGEMRRMQRNNPVRRYDSHIGIRHIWSGDSKYVRMKHLVVADQPDPQMMMSLFGEPGNEDGLQDYEIFKKFYGNSMSTIIGSDDHLDPATTYLIRPRNASREWTPKPWPAGYGVNILPRAQFNNSRTIRVTFDSGKRYFTDPENLKYPEDEAGLLATAIAGRLDAMRPQVLKGGAFGLPTTNSRILVRPYMLYFDKQDISTGAYEELDKIQGKNRTWWAGPVFNDHHVGKQWLWAEKNILPKLLKD